MCPMPERSILIRRATVNDDHAIAAIGDSTWRDAYADLVPAALIEELTIEARVESRIERRRTAVGHRTFVAATTRPDRVVGYCSCGPARGVGIADPREGEIYSLYVHPDAQGQGIGAELQSRAEAELIEREFDKLRLWVLTENAPSRRFYERMGMEVRIERKLLTFAGHELAHTLYVKSLVP